MTTAVIAMAETITMVFSWISLLDILAPFFGSFVFQLKSKIPTMEYPLSALQSDVVFPIFSVLFSRP
jgi:hypothetical protein